jgi:outer membrane lipoprotein-sorting protein
MGRINVPLFLLCAGIALLETPAARAQQVDAAPVNVQQPALTVDEIVSRLEERNRDRAAALKKFEGKRVYRMQYKGSFGDHHAEMIVSVHYTSPNDREFTVISQSGSKFIIDHVFKRLLDGEKEAANEENRRRTDLNAKNYEFTMVGLETSEGGPTYVLAVEPKSHNKFLYRGNIWVDAKDYALTRIEAEPAKSPSFWVKKSEINHKYEKVDEFWLPAENRTDSTIRLGGHALLSIEYSDYKITEAAPLAPDESIHNNASAGPARP